MDLTFVLQQMRAGHLTAITVLPSHYSQSSAIAAHWCCLCIATTVHCSSIVDVNPNYALASKSTFFILTFCHLTVQQYNDYDDALNHVMFLLQQIGLEIMT